MLTDLKYRVFNVITQYSLLTKKKKELNIEIDEKLVRYSLFNVRTLTFFQVIMLINLVKHAN